MTATPDPQKNKSFKKIWLPRIITFVVSFMSILYFYPNIKRDNLYRYKVGQAWEHGNFVTTDTLIVPPADTVALRNSVRASFRTIYDPVFDSRSPMAKAILDSVNMYLGQYLLSGQAGHFAGWAYSDPIRLEVQRNLRRFYRGKVIDLDQVNEKPNDIELTRDMRNFNDTIVTTADILESIRQSIENRGIPSDIVDDDYFVRLIRPNVAYNEALSTQRFYAELGLKIAQKTDTMPPGFCIIADRDVVTPYKARLVDIYTANIKSSEAVSTSVPISLMGHAVYILLLLGVLVLYLRFYAPRVWSDTRSFVFIVSLVGLFVVLSAVMSKFMVLGLFIIPIVMVPILVQVFFHARTALWVGMVTIMLCAGMSSTGMLYVAIEFVGIAAAVFSLRDLTKRSQLLKTSIIIGLAYIVMYFAWQWATTGNFGAFLWRMVVVLAINALLTSVCYVLMFAVERIFGFVSNVTLIELTDINNPLLRSLSDECPGTFNHVMAVSNLASDAARQIGANTLLTRAGAMYHDIGKLANPAFFTENQHGVNPHDGLDPRKSAEIIINHVPEGLKRAEKAGLPPVIRDFISEHHGAGLAKYFYITYCKQHPDEDVDPTPFKYPGPNPRSRETSVVMMADAVEAASRSLKEHTAQAITDLVNKIIDGQIADGLHNDSPLSFNDVRIIKDVFIHRLMTMYHTRIAYPDSTPRAKTANT